MGTDRVSLVDAIARQEGYYVHGSRAHRNNNPGNINYGVFARMHGSTARDDQGYAVFPSASVGFSALTALLISTAYRCSTLRDAITRYCPPTGDPRGANNTAVYIRNVSEWTGIGADDEIFPYITAAAPAPK